MSDMEMVQLCAAAMGLSQYTRDGVPQRFSSAGILIDDDCTETGYSYYDPLSKDDQAMALLKRFRLTPDDLPEDDPLPEEIRRWRVYAGASANIGVSKDLNRAIVEAVAKMQAYK